jgi:hypothetical protein
MNLLIVDFNEAAPYQMFFIGLGACQSDNLVKSSGNDTLGLLAFRAAHHGMGFAATGLSIGKNSSVISFEDIID